VQGAFADLHDGSYLNRAYLSSRINSCTSLLPYSPNVLEEGKFSEVRIQRPALTRPATLRRGHHATYPAPTNSFILWCRIKIRLAGCDVRRLR
jgi:hypothetical protein